jgi:hypothetical protein
VVETGGLENLQNTCFQLVTVGGVWGKLMILGGFGTGLSVELEGKLEESGVSWPNAAVEWTAEVASQLQDQLLQ